MVPWRVAGCFSVLGWIEFLSQRATPASGCSFGLCLFFTNICSCKRQEALYCFCCQLCEVFLVKDPELDEWVCFIHVSVCTVSGWFNELLLLPYHQNISLVMLYMDTVSRSCPSTSQPTKSILQTDPWVPQIKQRDWVSMPYHQNRDESTCTEFYFVDFLSFFVRIIIDLKTFGHLCGHTHTAAQPTPGRGLSILYTTCHVNVPFGLWT